MGRRFPLLLLLMNVLWLALPCYGARLYTSLSQDTLTLGERVVYVVSIVAPAGSEVTPPAEKEAFSPCVRKKWNTVTHPVENRDSTVFRFLLTTYRMEPCSIPELPFIVALPDQAPDTLYTPVQPLRVVSVIDRQDSVDIKEIKPLRRAGVPPRWPWVVGGLLCLVVVVVIIWHLFFRPQKRIVVPPPPPPWEEAVEALDRLQARGLLRQGHIREYVFELSEIFKRYCGRRYRVPLAESTSQEMRAWCERAPLLREQKETVCWFIDQTDPIKFARVIPPPEIREELAPRVRRFLDATRPAARAGEPGAGQESDEKRGDDHADAKDTTAGLPKQAANKETGTEGEQACD